MAMNPQFASTPRISSAQITVANALRDGSGAIETVFTAGGSGSRIDSVTIKATGTTTAGMVRLFIHDGTSSRLLTELPVYAATPSGTTPAWEASLNANTMSQLLPIILPTGYSLRASTHNAEIINVIASGGNF